MSEPATTSALDSGGGGGDEDVGAAAFGSMSSGGLVAILVVGASLMVIVLLIVAVMVVKKCCGRRHRDPLLEMDYEYGCCVTKSAPSTRPSSPGTPRKTVAGPRGKKVLLMRSLTADMLPTDFDLPPERVQPLGSINTTETVKADLGTVTAPVSPEIPYDSCGGQLWFSLLYDSLLEELTVNLIKAKGLPPRKSSNSTCNPYVKVYLLPDESKCYESKVKKKTLAPRFEEKYKFQVYHDELDHCELRLSVYDLDQRRTRHSLGYVRVPLSNLDLSDDLVLCKDLTTHTDHG